MAPRALRKDASHRIEQLPHKPVRKSQPDPTRVSHRIAFGQMVVSNPIFPMAHVGREDQGNFSYAENARLNCESRLWSQAELGPGSSEISFQPVRSHMISARRLEYLFGPSIQAPKNWGRLNQDVIE